MMNLTRLNSVGEALRDAMVPFKSNVALIEANRDRENGRWSYRELRTEAERVTALLQDKSTKFGFGMSLAHKKRLKGQYTPLSQAKNRA